jgi:hypothetical protein
MQSQTLAEAHMLGRSIARANRALRREAGAFADQARAAVEAARSKYGDKAGSFVAEQTVEAVVRELIEAGERDAVKRGAVNGLRYWTTKA